MIAVKTLSGSLLVGGGVHTYHATNFQPKMRDHLVGPKRGNFIRIQQRQKAVLGFENRRSS